MGIGEIQDSSHTYGKHFERLTLRLMDETIVHLGSELSLTVNGDE